MCARDIRAFCIIGEALEEAQMHTLPGSTYKRIGDPHDAYRNHFCECTPHMKRDQYKYTSSRLHLAEAFDSFMPLQRGIIRRIWPRD